MRIVFMGSGSFACPVLRSLLDHSKHQVVAVIAQPDRPAGRHLQTKACPVKALAHQRGLVPLTPNNASSPEFVADLAKLAPDIIVVTDYGQFLKPNLLAVPALGAINIHPSLLPKYRGAAPIHWAIANGETETGVTVLYVTEKMDAGDIILQERVPILDDATTQTLEPLLAEVGANLLLRALDDIQHGRAQPTPQDERLATYAPKLKKEDGRIDWNMTAASIANRIRAFQPWPSTFCEAPAGSGRMMKVLKAKIESASGPPGVVIDVKDSGPLIACGSGSLRLLEVQPEGKKAMSGSAFLCGHRLEKGSRLG